MTERVLTVRQIKSAERRAIEVGSNEDILIENAAAAAYARIKPKLKKTDFIGVFVGSGNNAADGLSLARLLYIGGYKVQVVTVSDKMNGYAAARLKILTSLGASVVSAKDAATPFYSHIIDAVFGVGISRDPEGEYAAAIDLINRADAYKIALDIPSGLGADDGRVFSRAVKADMTVSFGAYKYGHFLGSGADFCGELFLEDIGIRSEEGALLCGENTPNKRRRNRVGHKGDYGRVRIVGGSKNMIGAPLLAAMSALKSGAGLVTLCVERSLADHYRDRICEAMLCTPDDSDGHIICDKGALDKVADGADAICIGMGMGSDPYLADAVIYLAHNFGGILVVDADGLNSIAKRTGELSGHKCTLVLTPHRGEFSRLFGEYEDSEIVGATQAAAKELGAVIVNKSNVTIVTDGKTVYLNAAGTPAMAKGGSGDTLCGAIGAYSVRYGALAGAARACYECGKAGERAAELLGEDAVLARDIIKNIEKR